MSNHSLWDAIRNVLGMFVFALLLVGALVFVRAWTEGIEPAQSTTTESGHIELKRHVAVTLVKDSAVVVKPITLPWIQETPQ